MYTIGQVSERFDLPVSTLRYYDKEGLFPNLTRTSGARRFGEQELETLRVIECLKRSGLEIREIRQFMEWCAQGSDTYPQRHALFVRQAERVEAEIERLETKIAEVESQMSDEKNAADYNAMQELSSAHETLSEALETAFEQWSALQES